MQYWRELPPEEQESVLATTEKILLTFPPLTDIRERFSSSDFEKFQALAEEQLREKFDVPSHFSARACEGLLATILLSMADEKEAGEPYAEPLIAEVHMLLLKPD